MESLIIIIFITFCIFLCCAYGFYNINSALNCELLNNQNKKIMQELLHFQLYLLLLLNNSLSTQVLGNPPT